MVFIFHQLLNGKENILPLKNLCKRKQALLESNLSGITWMRDEKVKINGLQLKQSIDIFERFMPLKTHQ